MTLDSALDGATEIMFHSEALENILTGGGFSESGYDHRSIVGVELVHDEQADSDG